MRARDVAIILLCAFFLLSSLIHHEGSIELNKSFVHTAIHYRHRTTQNLPGTSPSHHELRRWESKENAPLPTPIVTDIDGDGIKEMLSVSYGSHVEILDMKPISNTNMLSSSIKADKFVNLRLKLIQKIPNGHGSKIMGLQTGFTDATSKSQMIFIVTDAWKLLCFDSKMTLLWSTNILEEEDEVEEPASAHDVPTHLPESFPSDVRIVVLPQRVHINDEGMVIVGTKKLAEFADDVHHTWDNDDDDDDDDEHKEGSDRSTTTTNNNKKKKKKKEKGERGAAHFSYYCFDGKTGTRRWKHESQDFHDEEQGETLHPQHNYKLDAKRHTSHTGEVDWRVFQQDIIDNLPHVYRAPEDISLSVDHFDKNRKENAVGTEATTLSSKLPRRLQVAQMQQQKSRHKGTPNVLVAHLDNKVEIVHLYTGRTIAQLAPLKLGAAYHDLDNDGIIDSASTSYKHKAATHERVIGTGCQGVIESGITTTETLLSASICGIGTVLDRFTQKEQGGLDNIQSVPPVIVERWDAGENRIVRDVVFYVSTGLISSFGIRGRGEREWSVNWRRPTESKWQQKQLQAAAQAEEDEDVDVTLTAEEAMKAQEEEEGDVIAGFLPSLQAYTLRGINRQYLIAVGEKYLSVLNSDDGTIEKVIKLPKFAAKRVIAPPSFVDVNGDGFDDVMLTVRVGDEVRYLVYTVTPHGGGTNILTTLVVVLVVVLALMYISTKQNIVSSHDPFYVLTSEDRKRSTD